MSRIDLHAIPEMTGCGYPAPFHEPCMGRRRRRAGEGAGLSDFGVNFLHLAPGAWSSQRHWHLREDEFVYVIEGEVTLVTDAGEQLLRAGDCAGFKAGIADGHHLINRSDREAVVLEVGSRKPDDAVDYPDIDLCVPEGTEDYCRKDGTPYPKR